MRRQAPLFLLGALLAAGVMAAGAIAADKAPPSWLTEASTREIPDYSSDVSAVVLFEEKVARVDPTGLVTTTVRKAVKVLSRSGRKYARGAAVYRTGSGKVRDLRGWLLYPSGKHESYGKKETADVALADNDVYNEARVKFISAASAADPGAVFGYESVVEDRSVFTQFLYQFHGAEPALTSRFTLDLPAGWTARSVTFNHAEIEPYVQGSRYTWQLTDLPPIESEPARPSISDLAPRVAVSYFPPDSVSGLGPSFEDWADVSGWLASLSDPQATADEAVRAKAQELTADESTELGKISAIGRFAQDIKYVSIQTGVGRGGGYKPHPASQVFSNAYGDCKDKSNLMRAMLTTLGIESYSVALYSGDRRFVRPEWASPQQFNHAIIAVRISEQTDAAAVAEVEGVGRLLLFDPTNPYTPPGELPEVEQDSWALLAMPRGGRLIRLPAVEPKDNLLQRTVTVQLTDTGSIQAEIQETATGDSAAGNRAIYESRSKPEYRKIIERWITRGAPGASVSTIEAADADGVFELKVTLEVADYGQSMGGRLLVFKPAIVSRRDRVYLTDETRAYPVELNANAFQETVTVTLPAGFVVDEKPQDVSLETDFGSYQAQWKAAEGELTFSRKLLVRNAMVPADEYAGVRDFFSAIVHAEQTPVVLLRK